MTTPAQPTPSAPATADSQAPVGAKAFFQQDDAALAQAWGVPDHMTTPRAEEAPETVDDPLPPPPSEKGAAVAGEAGAVDLKPIDRKLMTEFSVLDNEGEVIIPDVKIRFKAKGETRELPIDHVVRLAQFGYANEEREQQVLAARKFVAEAEQEKTTYLNQIQQYEQSYERLFNDPAFYEEARLAFLSQNTPEMRAQRAEQQLHRERQALAVQQEQQEVAVFTQQALVPAITKLLADNPHVNEHEVIGRYTELTAPLLVSGRVPRSRFAQVQRLVQEDLAQWVEQKHVEREIEKRGQVEKTQRAEAEAAKQVAATKRQASRLFAHQGTPSANPNGPIKPVKYTSAKDWLQATFATPNE